MKNIGLKNSLSGFKQNKKDIKSITIGTVGGRLSIEILTELSIDSYMYKTQADLNYDLYRLKKELEWENIPKTKPTNGS